MTTKAQRCGMIRDVAAWLHDVDDGDLVSVECWRNSYDGSPDIDRLGEYFERFVAEFDVINAARDEGRLFPLLIDYVMWKLLDEV
jgi:hypothetical protein